MNNEILTGLIDMKNKLDEYNSMGDKKPNAHQIYIEVIDYIDGLLSNEEHVQLVFYNFISLYGTHPSEIDSIIESIRNMCPNGLYCFPDAIKAILNAFQSLVPIDYYRLELLGINIHSSNYLYNITSPYEKKNNIMCRSYDVDYDNIERFLALPQESRTARYFDRFGCISLDYNEFSNLIKIYDMNIKDNMPQHPL